MRVPLERRLHYRLYLHTLTLPPVFVFIGLTGPNNSLLTHRFLCPALEVGSRPRGARSLRVYACLRTCAQPGPLGSDSLNPAPRAAYAITVGYHVRGPIRPFCKWRAVSGLRTGSDKIQYVNMSDPGEPRTRGRGRTLPGRRRPVNPRCAPPASPPQPPRAPPPPGRADHWPATRSAHPGPRPADAPPSCRRPKRGEPPAGGARFSLIPSAPLRPPTRSRGN